MFDEVINHMTEDELRNYTKHQSEIVEASLQLNQANQELMHFWKQIVTYMEYQHDCLLKRNNRLSELRGLEKELEQKYDEFIPKPVYGCVMEGDPFEEGKCTTE
jgi:DNA repair exonuclease SbcCD ATPase subunit